MIYFRKYRWVLAVISFLLFCALKANVPSELQIFLADRTRANFRGHENPSFVMPKGTRGQIVETKEFGDGYGIKVKFLNEPRVGQLAWLYSDTKSPAGKFYKDLNSFNGNTETNEIENADALETKQELSFYQEARNIPLWTTKNPIVEVSEMLGRAPASEEAIPLAYQQITPFAKDPVGQADAACGQKIVEGDNNLTYCGNESQNHEFTLSNRGSPNSMNPIGGAAKREFTFSAPQNAKQDSGLLVYEWGISDDTAADSAWSMMTEIIFFPRKVMPAIKETVTANGQAAYQVTIQTGESIFFDKKTKEILSGALLETAPIDGNPDRQARKFAGLKYVGNGIMVRSDQRGETPRSAVVWGQKKRATIVWGEKSCKVSPADIWQQVNGEGGAGLYASDDDFYVMLQKKCNWKVSGKDFSD